MNRIERVIDRMHIPFSREVSVMEIYAYIRDFCRAEGKGPERFAWTLKKNDNVLCRDGVAVKRVGPKMGVYRGLSDGEYYHEKALFTRQEWMMPD